MNLQFLNDADRLAFDAINPSNSFNLKEFKKHYNNGKTATNSQFGRDFATSCVEHIIEKIDPEKFGFECAITEAKNLYNGLQHLNYEHYEFGVNAFKDLLILKNFTAYSQIIEKDEGPTILNSLNIDIAANIQFKNKEQEEIFFLTMFQPLTGKTMILNNDITVKPISYSIKF